MTDKPKKVKVKKQKEKLHGNRIKQILSEIQMSQQELADLSLDGDAAFLSKIINGHRRCISLPIAMKIAKALSKKVEEVFISKDENDLKRAKEGQQKKP